MGQHTKRARARARVRGRERDERDRERSGDHMERERKGEVSAIGREVATIRSEGWRHGAHRKAGEGEE